MTPRMYLAGTAALSIVTTILPQTAHAVPAGAGSLVWSDDFNASTIDSNKWSIHEPGVWGDAINDASGASIVNGKLKITTYTSGGKNYNAIVSTRDHFNTRYGYFEARIEFNDTPGEWSAFWLNSKTIGTPVGNPQQAGVEMDVVEHRSVNDSNVSIANRYNTALHWDGYGANHQYVEQLTNPIASLGNGNWHTYGLLWSPTSLTMYMDDVPMWTQTAPISQTAEYMLLSSQVQDGSWAGSVPAGGYGSIGSSTTNMLVDYVNVYSLAATPEPTSVALLGVGGLSVLSRRRRSR